MGGFLGNIFNGNDELLWFIILFLLLFYCCNFGGYGYGCGTGPAAK